jgi:hypothetical protein
MQEAEAGAEPRAVLGHRLPQRGVGGVVVHHHDLEIRVVEPRQRIQRLAHQAGRLVADRDVDGDFRQPCTVFRRHRQEAAAGVAAPQRLAELETVGH